MDNGDGKLADAAQKANTVRPKELPAAVDFPVAMTCLEATRA
jgi:hypothetical protein